MQVSAAIVARSCDLPSCPVGQNRYAIKAPRFNVTMVELHGGWLR
jgi:hypothetical protein